MPYEEVEDARGSSQPSASAEAAASATSTAAGKEAPPRRGAQTRQRLLSETRPTATSSGNTRASRSHSPMGDGEGGSSEEDEIPPTAKKVRTTKAAKSRSASKGKGDEVGKDGDKEDSAQHRRERRRVTLQARRSQHSRSLAELAALLPEDKLREIISKSTNGGEASTIDVAQVMLEQAAENNHSAEWNPFRKPYDKSLIEAVRVQPPNRRLILLAAVDYIKELQKFSADVLVKNHSLVAARLSMRHSTPSGSTASSVSSQAHASTSSHPPLRFTAPIPRPSAPPRSTGSPYHAPSTSESQHVRTPSAAAVNFTNPFSQPHLQAQHHHLHQQQQQQQQQQPTVSEPAYTDADSTAGIDDLISYDDSLNDTFAKLRSCLPAPEPTLPGYSSLPYY